MGANVPSSDAYFAHALHVCLVGATGKDNAFSAKPTGRVNQEEERSGLLTQEQKGENEETVSDEDNPSA